MGLRILNTSKGFTIVELATAVAILGILVMIAFPTFVEFSAKSRQSEAKANLSGLHAALRVFHNEWDGYTGDFRDIGFAIDGRRLNYDIGFAGPGYYPANRGAPSSAGGCPPRTAYNTEVSPCALESGTTSLQAKAPFQVAPATAHCGGGLIPTKNECRATAVGYQLEDRLDIWTIDHNKVLCNNISPF